MRASALEVNDAGGYDLIQLPNGERTRVFTKQEFRLDANGLPKEAPPRQASRGSGGRGRGGGRRGRAASGRGGVGGRAQARAGDNPWSIAAGGAVSE